MSGRGNYHIIVCFTLFFPLFQSSLSLFPQSSGNRCVIRAGIQLDHSLCFLTKGIPKGGRYYKKGWSSFAKAEVVSETHCSRRSSQFLTTFALFELLALLSMSRQVESAHQFHREHIFKTDCSIFIICLRSTLPHNHDEWFIICRETWAEALPDHFSVLIYASHLRICVMHGRKPMRRASPFIISRITFNYITTFTKNVLSSSFPKAKNCRGQKCESFTFVLS